jgi:nitrogen fixation protein NifX
MKVAFTSSAGATVDGNFCKSKSFSIWDIGPHEAYYVTTLNIEAESGNEDDRIAARAEALKECAIVYAMQINGPAAAKLVARKIHPMKTGDRIAIEEIIGKLQDVLRSSLAPWIRKAQIKDVSMPITVIEMAIDGEDIYAQ